MEARGEPAQKCEGELMDQQLVYRLLRDVGFRNVLWPSPLGQLWGVVGELDGGIRIVITCMPAPLGQFRLHVTPAAASDWLREILSANGAPQVPVTPDPVRPPPPPRSSLPWVTLSLGLVSVAVFGWVLLRGG